LRGYRILLKTCNVLIALSEKNRFVDDIRQQPEQMLEIAGKPETATSRSTDCRKRAIPVRLSEHGYNRFIDLSRMPEKAFIRANDEF
jgi:hypothetical protein